MPVVVLVQGKRQNCKMGARGRVGQQQLSLGWADVAVEFHPEVKSNEIKLSGEKSTLYPSITL